MEPPWLCVEDSGTLHIPKKGITTVEVPLQGIVLCCLLSPFRGDVFPTQFLSDLSPSSEAGCCHGHAVFGSAGSAALFSVKTLIK